MNNVDKITKQSVKIIVPIVMKIGQELKKIDEYIEPKFRIYKKNKFIKTDIAYASCIFIDEAYIPAVLILAYTLRKYKVSHNIICFVQDMATKQHKGVSKKGIDDLLDVFDVVYGVNLLEVNIKIDERHFATKEHYKNITAYVTKCNVFGLLDYQRIIYIDASTIVHKNIDYLTKMEGNIQRYDKTIETANMGVNGNIFIIEPSLYYYTKAIILIEKYNEIFGNLCFRRRGDETIIYFTVYPNWNTNTIPVWTICIEKFIYKKCPLYGYQICKPFRKEGDNCKENTYKLWYKFAKEFITNRKYMHLVKYFKHIEQLFEK